MQPTGSEIRKNWSFVHTVAFVFLFKSVSHIILNTQSCCIAFYCPKKSIKHVVEHELWPNGPALI